ncbi:partial ATP-dependent RNA helicase HrpA, partial [Anaerolineae bacterium]
MAKEWKVICKDCGKEFGYSDWSYQAGVSRGQSRPERCAECRKVHNRQTGTMGLSYFDLKPLASADTSNVQPGSLGKLNHPPREHSQIEHASHFDPTKFGITDADVKALFDWLAHPKHQVAVVVGPTGSGKSTVLPYRLISPPAGLPQDQFTKYGQIVITQPRIQATRNIPAYVAKELYGSNIGSGYDIGFRHSNNPFSDWRNRLVYVTDGTVINWIVTGQIANLSAIMIDEAHERSLNIDLILGLLKKLLPRYPHLKLIIASATIDSGLFLNYFGKETATLIEFQGVRKFNVETFFEDESEELPYEAMPKLRKVVPDHVANKVMMLLEKIASNEKESGDILAFLQGEQPIERAVTLIRQRVKSDPKLADKVDVFPLYTTLPQEEQNKALLKKPDPSKRRVVVTTNVAETSLTVEDVVYVVDSGLINEARWDSKNATKEVVTTLQSQAGCKQRWGRAGRVRDGQAFCLYTENQFKALFPEFTVPQIQRSELDQIVLTAKAAGIDDIRNFDWIQKPPDEELDRAPRVLQKIGALDEKGDLTEHGLNLQAFADEPTLANLMTVADRFACAIEMATLLPMIKVGGLRHLLKWDRKWNAATRRAVGQIHVALKKSCHDDLEFCLKLYTAWSEAQSGGQTIAPEWAFREVWPRYVPTSLSKGMKEILGSKVPDFLNEARKTIGHDKLRALADKYKLGEEADGWLEEVDAASFRVEREAWARAFFVNHSVFKNKIDPERETLLEALSGHKKEEERRPIDFDLLDRVRIILAYCLPERRYQKDGADNAVAFGSNGSDSPILYQRLGQIQSTEESESSVEVPVQINQDSVCFEREIEAFVCTKQQIVTRRLTPQTPLVPIMHVSYLSLVNAEWFKWMDQPDLSEVRLGLYISSLTRDFKTGELQSTGAYTRLFLDQLFAIGSRYNCRVEHRSANGAVELIPVQRLREMLKVQEDYRSDEPDAIQVTDAVEEDEGVVGDLPDTVLAEDGAPILVADPEDEVIPAWVDLTDDSLGFESEEIPAKEIERQLQEGVRFFLTMSEQTNMFQGGEILSTEVVDFD